MTLLVTGAGTVTWAGLGDEALSAALTGEVPFVQEDVLDGAPVTLGRVGRVVDKDSSARYRRWGQLDNYSRYAFVAARLAMQQAGLLDRAEHRQAWGVILGTAWGCMEENQKFDRFEILGDKVQGASPLVFKGTVDNAPAGWLAVAWKLKGPTLTFVSGDGAALEALWSAVGMLESGRAPGLLVGGAERFVDLHLILRERDPATQGSVLSEGAGVLAVETAEALRARGGDPDDALAELVGVVRHRGPIADGLAAAAGRLRFKLRDVGLLSLAVPPGVDLPPGLPDVPVVCDKAVLGEFHGAWGAVAACAALGRRDGGWSGRPLAIVHAYGEGLESFYAVLRDPRHDKSAPSAQQEKA